MDSHRVGPISLSLGWSYNSFPSRQSPSVTSDLFSQPLQRSLLWLQFPFLQKSTFVKTFFCPSTYYFNPKAYKRNLQNSWKNL